MCTTYTVWALSQMQRSGLSPFIDPVSKAKMPPSQFKTSNTAGENKSNEKVSNDSNVTLLSLHVNTFQTALVPHLPQTWEELRLRRLSRAHLGCFQRNESEGPLMTTVMWGGVLKSPCEAKNDGPSYAGSWKLLVEFFLKKRAIIVFWCFLCLRTGKSGYRPTRESQQRC